MIDWHAERYGPRPDLTPLGISICIVAFVLLFWLYISFVGEREIIDIGGSGSPSQLERPVPKTD